MSKRKGIAPSAHSSLSRLLDEPQFVRLVPRLAPELLHQVIRQSGLDACGELVAAATPEQLTSILDLDLWRHDQPGRDEQFDADRFGEWVEMMVDADETAAARIVAALDEHLVVAGLSRYVRVFDPPAIAPPASDDDASGPDAPGPAVYECRVGGYLVCATRPDAWDAIVALLVALDAAHPEHFHAVMRGCRLMSNSTPEVDGLDSLLTAPQQQLHDIAVARERRRSRHGYSSPADARAFLQMARQPSRRRPADGPLMKMNPIAAAYFRAADDTAARPDASRPGRTPEATLTGADAEGLDALVRSLADAGLVPEQPRALLEGTAPEASRLTRLLPLMAHVRDTDDTAYFTRNREMAFLVNTVMAGSSVQSRPFTAPEASDAVASICNLGLEHWPARWPEAERREAAQSDDRGETMPSGFLLDHDLVTTFAVGWAVLHEDVSMFVAAQLIATLTGLRCADADTQKGLRALRRELVKQRKAGTPWRAREALEVLAILDMPSWVSLSGLLDECPVLPAAVRATLDGHAGPVSATAFEFISTAGQVDEVRAFMGQLLDALSR
jgi:hypothetical protein